MQQPLHQEHRLDVDGNPAGGMTDGIGITIYWQNGPLSVDGERREQNGAFVEGVIAAAIGRLEHYQASKFACIENAQALYHLEVALSWLKARTAIRTARGVEGTHEL